MVNYRKYIVWGLIIAVLILFWISLRSPVNQMEYSIGALVLWGITYLIDKKLKKMEDERSEDQ